MATVVHGDFEWDDAKALANEEKHRVSFEQAAVALLDPYSHDLDDQDDPNRISILGAHPLTGVLYVITCDGSEERTRIISARKADSHEHHQYEEARSR